jgi:predicted esterase
LRSSRKSQFSFIAAVLGLLGLASKTPDAPTMSPLVGRPWLMRIAESPKVEDVVTLPLGANEPRPLVVAVHGAGDRPDWACGGWRIGMESYAFVVCPMGLPMAGGVYGWSSTTSIAAAATRAISSVRQKFQGYVGSGPMIYAGFSQGAILANDFLVKNAAKFPIAVLAEGGYGYLATSAFAHRYHAAGGRRLLVLCGTPGCFVNAKRAQSIAEREGLEVIVTGDPKAGHNLNGLMQQALQRDWHRLVAGIEGWESYAQHRWKKSD